MRTEAALDRSFEREDRYVEVEAMRILRGGTPKEDWTQ
jgi:hypothetical protein